MTFSGNQYEIAAGSYQATITEQGGGLRALTYEGRALVLPSDPAKITKAGVGQLLMPWPNRIDHGTYTFEGHEHRLPLNEADKENAIHGLVRWEAWTLAEHTPSKVRMGFRLLGRPGYPFRLDLTATYELHAEEGLTVTLGATNVGDGNAPYGQSAHPYLTVGVPLDECAVRFGAGTYLPVNDRLIPSGPPVDVSGTPYDLSAGVQLGDRLLDTAYTDLKVTDGRAWVRLAGAGRAVGLWADQAHPWMQLYTGEALGRQGLAAEPMTCPPDAFNSGVDLITLKPGAVFAGSWGIISL